MPLNAQYVAKNIKLSKHGKYIYKTSTFGDEKVREKDFKKSCERTMIATLKIYQKKALKSGATTVYVKNTEDGKYKCNIEAQLSNQIILNADLIK